MSFEIDDAEVVGETPNGFWIQAPIFDEDVFVPESQIHEDSEVSKSANNSGTLIVKDWLAEKRGWI